MNNRVAISCKFFKVNFQKYISAIITLTTFLLVLNLITGILFSTTGIFNNSITENNSMRFMEIINNGNMDDTIKIYEYLGALEGINDCFVDTSHPVMVSCNNECGMELYTLVGIPRNMLADLNLRSDSDKFLFLPEKDKNLFEDKVFFEDSVYVESANGNREAIVKEYEYAITGFYDSLNWDYFPDNLVLIDSDTAMDIAFGMSKEKDSIRAVRVIASAFNVEDMEKIQTDIKGNFPNTEVRFALKYAGNLPEYATIFVAISGIIAIVLIALCIFNIKNNIKQILILRQRDIALMSLFGVDSRDILRIFIVEFIFNGILSCGLSMSITLTLFKILQVYFEIDLLSNYIWIYVISNLLISIAMFSVISYILIKRLIIGIGKTQDFKNIIK